MTTMSFWAISTRSRARKMCGAGRKWTFTLLLVSVSVAFAQMSAPGSGGQSQTGQDSATQSQTPPTTSDLAAAAQRAREEREQQRSKRSANSEAVNEMATELSESAEEAIAAPVGYRYYNFQPGDYSILVPADAEVEGRDWHGLKLLSSEGMGSRTVVMLGNPIPNRGDKPAEIFRNAAALYLPGCRVGLATAGMGINTTVAAVNGHAAATVGLGTCQLNQEVLGYVQLVMGDGYVVPMVCGYPLTAEDLHPSPHRPIATVVKGYDRQNNGRRACDVILPSVRFHEHGSAWRPKVGEVAPKKAVITNALLNSNAAPDAGSVDGSLGNLVRVQKKTSSTEVLTELKHAAPGFSAYDFNYCTKQDCFTASLQIPVQARKNEHFQMAYTGLFEFVVPIGDTVAIIQGTTGAPSETSIMTREQFIHSKINWWIEYVPAVNFSGAGKAEVFSEQLTTLSRMPARLATFRSPTTIQPVMTQLAAYMAPGVFIQIRCSVPEKVYGDAQDMCEHVVRSLQTPQSRTGPADDPGDDDP
ncbi:MAG: hypothetical protein WCC78_17660 [Terriglobales bacterium]